MKSIITIIFLSFFVSCAKNLYQYEIDGKKFSAILDPKKSREHLIVSFRSIKDEKGENSLVWISKANCDSFEINTYQLVSKKPLNQKRKYFVSAKEIEKLNFTANEMVLLETAKKITDSLHWCQFNLLRFTQIQFGKRNIKIKKLPIPESFQNNISIRIYSTTTAPSTNTVTLLFSTSTKPPCIS